MASVTLSLILEKVRRPDHSLSAEFPRSRHWPQPRSLPPLCRLPRGTRTSGGRAQASPGAPRPPAPLPPPVPPAPLPSPRRLTLGGLAALPLPPARYMATSDLANELAKDTFRFDSPSSEKQVSDVVLTQLEDTSGDISGLAVKW